MGEIKQQVTLRERENGFWMDDNGWLYKRDSSGCFYPILSPRPKLKWYERLFGKWESTKPAY